MQVNGRSRKWYAGVTALLVAFGAVLGLATPSAASEAGHLISGKSIKKHSISGNRLKNNTLTGKQIKESTLGQVPAASNATRLGGAPASSYQSRVMWAYVSSDGVIHQQSGGLTIAYHASGSAYFIGFPRSLTHAALSVTPFFDIDSTPENVTPSTAVCGYTGDGYSNPTTGQYNCVKGGNTTKEAIVVFTNSCCSGSEQYGFYITATL